MAEFTRLPMFMFCPDLLVCLHTVGHAPHHTPLQEKTKILKFIQTFESPQNQQKRSSVIWYLGVTRNWKRQIKKVSPEYDRLKNSVCRKTSPPSAGHTCKENKQATFGRRHHCSGGGPNSSMACPPPHCRKQKTWSVMAAAIVYMCEKADICRLFALFYHALGCRPVKGPMSSRSCIVPRTLIPFLIAFPIFR